ncbi:MAG: superoxide dismutase [Anaerolineales bacterium]|jgi:Fe-Mn family superoxide dismutase
MAHEMPTLSYPYDALEPHLDARTMEIHFSKHHAGYVKNLNVALEPYSELQSKSLEALLADLDAVPESIRTAVRNNGGGHTNHTLFWQLMSPEGGGEPSGSLATAIARSFGDFPQFKERLSKTAVGQFGSGWGWLAVDKSGELTVLSTPGHDTPLFDGLAPILVVDVWEHAYYLNYQNRRVDFVSAWWNVIHWREVAKRYEEAMG